MIKKSLTLLHSVWHNFDTMSAMAFQKSNKDGSSHAAFIFDIKVLILNNDGSWFAQGLDLDYAAQGSSLEEVKKNFENGLEQTIQVHLETYGDFKGVMQVAPQEYWDKFFAKPSEGLVYFHSSLHFTCPKLTLNLEYSEPKEAALAGA